MSLPHENILHVKILTSNHLPTPPPSRKIPPENICRLHFPITNTIVNNWQSSYLAALPPGTVEIKSTSKT
jgi:hypothetical protein